MNLRLSAKGGWGGVFFLLVAALGTIPFASLAAGPPSPRAPVDNTADDSSNPYAIIVERNIFHLNPPPPPPEPEKPKVELPVIKITGFVSIGKVSRVLFETQPKGQKDMVYYSLTEGQSSGDNKLKLLKILPGQTGVDILNDGTPATLTVKADSLAPDSSPAPAAAAPPGGGPPIPGNGIPGRQLFHPPPPGGANPFQYRGRVALP